MNESIIVDVLVAILGACVIMLLIRVWNMTDNVKEIKRLLEDLRDRQNNKLNSKFNVGDHVTAKSHNDEMEIIDIYDDGTYNCIDTESNEIVGAFKENELTKKK